VFLYGNHCDIVYIEGMCNEEDGLVLPADMHRERRVAYLGLIYTFSLHHQRHVVE